MNAEELIREIRSYCKRNEDPESLQKYQRYFKGGYDGYGLNTTAINRKVKELNHNNSLTLSTILEAAPAFMESGMYEETSFALLLLNEKEQDFSAQIFETVGSWFAIGISNWAHADTLGMYVLPKFLKRNIIGLEDFEPWITSSYKFQRRCVPVTLIKSITSMETEILLEFVTPLINDSEREIHQGLGWFLREAWKKNKPEVEAFLLNHKNAAPRLIIQYACEKMTREEKLRYKRDKFPKRV